MSLFVSNTNNDGIAKALEKKAKDTA